MSREAENILLLLAGISIAMVAVTGDFMRYVKPALLPWLLATAALLIAVALTTIVRDVRRRSALNHHGGHTHRSGVVWLMVVPILVLIFVVPPALDARAATPRAVAVSADVAKRPFPPLPAGRAPTVTMPDVLMRAADDSSGSLHNRLITITGFTMKQTSGTDLARIVIVCCAADAQLARIHLGGPGAKQVAELPDNTWLSVEGTVTPQPPDATGLTVPTLAVSRATKIDRPANVYAY
jgi:uncharacterized repeat protein (TIGR03943 family)